MTTTNPVIIAKSLGTKAKVLLIIALIISVALPTVFVSVKEDLFILEILSVYATFAFMLWLAMIDAKYYTLPNKIILAWFVTRSLIIMLAVIITADVDMLINSLLGAVIMGAFFLATYYLSKKTLGGGDVKLSFVLGLSLTLYMVFTAVFYALVLCAIFSLVSLGLKRLTKKDFVPLGPFFFCGIAVAYVLEILMLTTI